ncbi:MULTISPECIES: damage-control phosphatase ARMT1 family protein [Kosmotoga]|uniref:Damage-control phosphatase ARMT1-like metal-binding domain-containing protein n=1 Tax=Kosmotoga olearia (strain ATCC BAA-1733 / DSM 21960 / TBF 19.5.1) TaxID=521045 RepID=C5CGB8_KOSOT|nr:MULTISPECIES: ARMT1-like domain-containing protein [Kosmotoga]ACR79559.1 protein of unknown function DUF89 [Kosmotoga olearia TBF 19.5.1]MDI3523927.1 damage-control phosphatase, subfamily [Kosmotoga sp.]MDK2953294.1 damage-control phosphatase, subfamily [Kosmotoga sp.]
MRSSIECIPCNMSSLIRILKKANVSPEAQQKAVKRFMERLLSLDSFDLTPVHMGHEIRCVISELFGEVDLYREMKDSANELLLSLYDDLKAEVLKSSNPIETALRFSVAGNIIDFAPGHEINVMRTLKESIKTGFAVNDLDKLLADLEKAKSILVIGDNCGEAVLDKLFLELLDIPVKYFAVRSAPVLNDVTIREARLIGIEEVATVIESGTNAPGTLLDRITPKFKDILYSSDVVISKGQGNFESLSDLDREIYFLLMAKCDVVSGYIGVEKGSFIALKGGKR